MPFLSVYGQESKKQAKSNLFLIGFNISPDYNFRTLSNNDGSTTSDLIIKTRNDGEIGKLGYTLGVNICIGFTKLISFETGIQYSNKGYQTKKQELTFQQPDPSLLEKSKFIYSYNYIDIPVKVNFITGKNKIRFISSVGFSTNFLITETQINILEYADGNSEKKKQPSTFDYKKVNISPFISLGLEYKFTNDVYVRTEPIFRYGMVKINNQPVTAYLWNTGLNIGFYYGLK